MKTLLLLQILRAPLLKVVQLSPQSSQKLLKQWLQTNNQNLKIIKIKTSQGIFNTAPSLQVVSRLCTIARISPH